MVARRARRGYLRRRPESGAAAVEFALVTPILFTVLFGTLQYGLYFYDTLGTRQGVRQAARLGVVEQFGSTGCNTGNSANKLRCVTKQQIDALTGDPQVKVMAPSAGGWAKGNRLVVCAAFQSDGAVGLLPMPNSGFIKTKTEMSIEKTASTLPTGFPTTADTDPTGQNWSWC
jgi:hypothetical protein